MTLPEYLSGGRIQGRSDDASGATSTIGTATGSNSGATRVSSPSPPTNLGTYYYDFDGSNDHITVNGIVNAFSGATGSVSFWINADAWDNDTWIWKATYSGDGTSDSTKIGCTINSSGYIYIEHRDTNSQNWTIRRTSPTMSTGTWYHIVVTQDGTSPKLYINGETGYTNGSDGVTFNEGDSNDKTRWYEEEHDEFAFGYSNTYWSNEYDGKITQFLVYDRVLTNNEIIDLYKGSTNGVGGTNGAGLASPVTDGLKCWYDFQQASGAITNQAISTDKSKDSITNVPVGTRYEETDTRKIFRMATVPHVTIDFDAGGEATESNWTHPTTGSGGNSGAHGFSITTESSLTGKAGTIDNSGRDWDSTIDMVTHCGLTTALPAQTKFVIDWDFYRHSDDTSDHPVFNFSSEARGRDGTIASSSRDLQWACEANNQDDSGNDGQNHLAMWAKNSSGTSYTNQCIFTGDSTSLQSKGETRYWRIIYGETASTYRSLRLQRYDTAENRTAGGSTGRELNLVGTGWSSAAGQAAWEAADPIRYFTLETYNNGQKAFSIDNVKWYDDSLTAVASAKTWKEKGTA